MSIMVWGHRGHRHHRAAEQLHDMVPHENSLRAYREVLSEAMGVECDVVQSRLKTPFLIHDTLFNGMVQYELKNQLDEVSRQLAQDRFVFDMNDDELEQLRLKDGQPIPHLKKLLDMMPEFPGRYINLELKGPNVADITVRSIERAIYRKQIDPQQVIFSSYNIPALRMLRANVGSRFKISLSFMVASQPLAQMYPNWPLAEQEAYYVPFSIDALQRPDIEQINPDFFSFDISSLNVETIEAIHFFFPKAKIIVWRSGEPHPHHDQKLMDIVETYASSDKLFAVISDYPLLVQHILEMRGINVARPEQFMPGRVAAR